MKLAKRIVSVLILFAILFSSFCFTAGAAGASASIAVSSTSPTVGSNITVSVTFSADDIGSVEGQLHYNSSVLQYVSGANTGGGSGVVTMSQWRQSTNSIKNMSFSMTFKVIGVGASSLSVSNASVWNYSENLVGNPTATSSITAKSTVTEQKSSNALLKGLTISSGSLSPAFSANTFSYNVSLPHSVATLLVTAYPADSSAVWTVEGSKNMNVGSNQRVVVVTAADGTVKRYTINIVRAADEGSSSVSSESTSSTETPEQPETQVDAAVKVTVGGAEYTLCNSLEGITAPNGFALDISNYMGSEIPVFKSESGCELAVLKDSDEKTSAFLYNKENSSFYKADSILLGGKEYLYVGTIDNDDTGEFSVKSVKLGEKDTQVYYNSDLKDSTVCFYAINANGELKLYLYDIAEDLLMQYDRMVVVREEVVKSDTEKPDKTNDIYLKISILVCAVLLVAVIVLTVLLITTKRKKAQPLHVNDVPYIDDDELKL